MPRLKCVSACEALRATNYLQSIAPNGCAGGVFSTTARARQLNHPRIGIKGRSHAVYIDDARAHRARRGGAPEWIPWLRTALRAASSATAARRERDRVNKPRSCGLKLVMGE
jgi:hypothetical protein